MSGEQFLLRFNAFESNFSEVLRDVRNDGDFFDVTLVCEDGQVQAHKLVIAACSPFFKKILQRNPHPHPLLNLNDITIGHLQSVMDFMYHGEVFIFQENLDSFLEVAQKLKVKGLTMPKDNSFLKPAPLVLPSLPVSNEKVNGKMKAQPCVKKEPMHMIPQLSEQGLDIEMNANVEVAKEKDHAQTEYQDVETMRDLDQFIQSETGKGRDPAKCHLCGKTFPRKKSARDHLAYKHFYHLFNNCTCQVCGKSLNSKSGYLNHMKKQHP